MFVLFFSHVTSLFSRLHVSSIFTCLWPSLRKRGLKVELVHHKAVATFGIIFLSLLPVHCNQLQLDFQSLLPELTRLAGSVPRGENVSIVTIIVLFKCMNKCTAKGASFSFIQRTFDRGAVCVYSRTTICRESEVINI